MDIPNRRIVKIVRARALHMSINPSTGAVTLLVQILETDRDCRNALHRAMKKGLDLPLGYETGENGPTYEAESFYSRG